ncbi:catechol 2,3-dioxygenase [Streptomyces sp. NE06-03E]|uniref:Catechol 2,3-dioxygenase n=1 Tax=Streptomyces silvae TaxID=2803812 RepID=A0ABU8A387_9ACTN|nr:MULTISPECIES: catechol 2,3-dioxygenase [unclassified Streptomyces]MDX3056702.1 catechol 2,3-dioxygenase [Streptomyces sp. NE06-03E]MDX3326691.1 catechol 2,3-dioxygenase [Streptomyces sp. ME02-6979-3A]MDX3686898.1 catechol 2,3-dioxygenase [Streptomyces sp. AK04-4c]WSS76774.1 catechol 2,3-dioxygenase [Streptomyces sp. NBC_01174]
MTPPLGDIAHLGHVELLTPDLDGSVRFFTDYLGLTVNGQDGDSVHLRTFDDYEHHSLVLTAAEKPGLRRTALRTSSEEALRRRVAELEATGHAGRWVEDEPGIGKLHLTADPDGHEIALYWESEYYQAPPELRPALKNQPQAKPNRGVGVRRLDHINFLAADVAANADFHQHVLGARPTEQIQLDTGRIGAKWLTFTDKSYDVVYTSDWTGSTGRLHHIAFATDTREDILRAADLAIDSGVFIETGPHKHAIQQTFFLYVYEPGGNRIELCNPLTRLVLAPDWPLVTWTEAERAKGQAWGLRTIESFHTHGTPPLD